MALQIYIDGGARGNPGPAAAAVVMRDEQARPLLEAGYFVGHMTNNVAEYTALLLSLEAAAKWGADQIAIFSDSELIVRQLTGEYKVRDEKLLGLYERAQLLLLKFDTWHIKHVRRDENRRADALVNEALDAEADVVAVQLGDARPDSRDAVSGPSAKQGQAGADPQSEVQACADVVVEVRTPGKPGRCAAGLSKGQQFLFGRTVPQDLCIFAAKAVIDTVLAIRHAAATGQGPPAMQVRCGLAGCGAEFEVRLAGRPAAT